MTQAVALSHRSGYSHWLIQYGACPLVIGLLLVWFAVTIDESVWTTWAFSLPVLFGGISLCTAASIYLRDPNVQKLGYIFLSKVCLVLMALHVGWIPQLNPLSDAFGYDPQRFYFEAAVLAEDAFRTPTVNVNYTGILFYYGLAFAAFGHNPIVPALLNVFVTLCSALLVLVVGYRLNPIRRRWNWLLGLCMLVPEVVWYDALTARETIAMSLIVFSVLPLGWALLQQSSTSRVVLAGTATLTGMIALSLVRTSMLIPVAASLVLVFLLAPSTARRRALMLPLLALSLVILVVGPLLGEAIGGYGWGYLEWLRIVRGPEYIAQLAPGWSNRSIGQLLTPNNLFEEVPFGIARMAAYLVAPLPNVHSSIEGLAAGSWSDWQSLLAATSALMYVCLFPLVMASLIELFHHRSAAHIVFHVPFWCSFAAIAISNLAITERYRVMMVPLLWACIWLGGMAPPRIIVRSYFAWAFILAFGTLFFIAYKL